jgi:lipoprotein-releasing system permease protein
VRLTLLLAARILKNGHVRGAAVAIALALVPLIVIVVVADGMIEGITSRYIELQTYHLRAYLPEDTDTEQALRAIRGVAGVTAAFLEIDGEGLVRSARGSTAVALRCVDPALGSEPGFSRYLEVVAGSFRLDAPGSALVGTETARKLGVGVGDELLLATLSSAGRTGLPRLTRLTVTGVFGTGYQELDKNWVFLSASDGARLLAPGRRDLYVGVKTVDPFGDRKPIERTVRAAVPSSRVYDWYQLEVNQFRSFEVTRNLLVFIMALVVLVGSVNVSSAVLMVVLERQQEIGILKSMGASPASIRRVYLSVGLFAGILGSLGGELMGVFLGIHVNELFGVVETVANALSAGVAWVRSIAGTPTTAAPFRILGSAYYLERIPVHLKLPELLGIAASAIGLSALAAWFPARRAGSLRPLEVIRKH